MADNKTNLVDLTLLNTAYKINKRRIDLLSEKVKTKNLEVVGTATTKGTLTVNSGDFSADTLTVTGGMTINGGGVTLPNGKALTLNGGGSVTKSANFDSLTGSVKFGNAVDADGNVTGSAQIVVPAEKSLSLSGSAVTNGKTTIEGTITASGTPSVSGSLHATDTEVTSGTTITGAIIASDTDNKTLTVYGNLKAEDTKVTSGTTITGAIIASNTDNKTLTVYGTANLSNSTIGSATINSSEKGSITILDNNTLTVSGTATLSGSTIGSANIKSIKTGSITIPDNNTLSVSGTATLSGSTIGSANIKSIKTGSITIPDNNTLSVSGTATLSGSTIGSANIKSIKTGSITIPDNNTLSVSGTATLSGSTIGSANINSGTVTVTSNKELEVYGKANLNNSTIGSATIQNGTVDLNSNKLTVTSASTITAITEGDKTTIEGVAAIKAKSMELTNTANNSSSLIINNTFGDNITDPNADLSKVALYCTGGIKGAKVFNAVWNDLADAIEVPFDTELEYGYCYKYKEGKVYKTDSYADANVMGIHSDTAGMVLGTKDKGTVCINLAVAGMVLAYVDKEYECGTALVATKEGRLTKANKRTRIFHPERIVATFYKTEIQDFWGSSTHKVAVNGRSWVKVR